MKPAPTLLVVLLLATNAAWIIHEFAREEEAPLFAEDTASLEREVDELKLELARARETPLSLVGSETPGTTSSQGQSEGGPATPEAGGGKQAKQPTAAAKKRDEQLAERAAYAKARKTADELLRKIRQVEDPALRQAGLDELAAALGGTDPYLIEYSLSVLHSVRDVDFDRASFISVVGAHLDSAHGGIRRSALYAMAAVNPDQVDQSRLLESARDPDPRVRGHTTRLMALSGTKAFEGPTAAAALALLEDEDQGVRRGTLRGLQGAEVTPALEQKLIAMAANDRDQGDALHFGLSTLPNKNRAVVDALLSHLDDANHNKRSRAHWGLQRNVDPAQRAHVADQYTRRLGKFLTPNSQREALKLIVKYGDDRLAPDLERFASNELVDKDIRTLATKAAAYLEEHKRR